MQLLPLLLLVSSDLVMAIDCAKMRTKELRAFLNDRGLRCEGDAHLAPILLVASSGGAFCMRRTALTLRAGNAAGCAEKADFVKMCEEHKDTPVLPKKPADDLPPRGGAGGKKDDQSIEDLLASMKGMPGMENIKVCAPSGIAPSANTRIAQPHVPSALVLRLMCCSHQQMFNANDLKNMKPEDMASSFGGGGGGGRRPQRSRSEFRKELVDFYTTYGLTDKLSGVDAALDKWKGREEGMINALYKKYEKEIEAHWEKVKVEGETVKDEM